MVLPKRSLVRLVRRPEGVQVDPTGKLAGRGAYLHNIRLLLGKGSERIAGACLESGI